MLQTVIFCHCLTYLLKAPAGTAKSEAHTSRALYVLRPGEQLTGKMLLRAVK